METLAHDLLTQIKPIIELLIFGLNILSVVILLWGVLTAGIDFIKNECFPINTDHIRAARHNNFIRTYLGSFVLLSLEVLIAADIIESIINPTWQDIIRLASVVLIRTIISFFLHREIEDAMKTEIKDSVHGIEEK